MNPMLIHRLRTAASRAARADVTCCSRTVPRAVELDPEQSSAVPAAVAAWCEEMDARGERLGGHVLAPLTEARTIRRRGGEPAVRDEQVSEQAIQIAGFNILDCADLDEALEVAAKNPAADVGVLELRPIVPWRQTWCCRRGGREDDSVADEGQRDHAACRLARAIRRSSTSSCSRSSRPPTADGNVIVEFDVHLFFARARAPGGR